MYFNHYESMPTNAALAGVTAIPTFYTFQSFVGSDLGWLAAVVVPVCLFFIGKGIDIGFKLFLDKRRQNRRIQRRK